MTNLPPGFAFLHGKSLADRVLWYKDSGYSDQMRASDEVPDPAALPLDEAERIQYIEDFAAGMTAAVRDFKAGKDTRWPRSATPLDLSQARGVNERALAADAGVAVWEPRERD